MVKGEDAAPRDAEPRGGGGGGTLLNTTSSGAGDGIGKDKETLDKSRVKESHG